MLIGRRDGVGERRPGGFWIGGRGHVGRVGIRRGSGRVKRRSLESKLDGERERKASGGSRVGFAGGSEKTAFDWLALNINVREILASRLELIKSTNAINST